MPVILDLFVVRSRFFNMASQWGGSIPPPPGVEVNLVDPPSQLPNNIALHTVCLTLATTLVAIRVYTRLGITKARLGLDDCKLAFSGGRELHVVPNVWY